MNGETTADSLRTRYFDWCSAKIAEQFLRLSPEEVWKRADRVRESPGPGSEGTTSQGMMVSPTNFEVVRTLAQQLADEMGLPAYDEWVEAYRRDPAQFEKEILMFGELGDPAAPPPPPSTA
jgi:hypothetical protein